MSNKCGMSYDCTRLLPRTFPSSSTGRSNSIGAWTFSKAMSKSQKSWRRKEFRVPKRSKLQNDLSRYVNSSKYIDGVHSTCEGGHDAESGKESRKQSLKLSLGNE